jgi:hypothetical protein
MPINNKFVSRIQFDDNRDKLLPMVRVARMLILTSSPSLRRCAPLSPPQNWISTLLPLIENRPTVIFTSTTHNTHADLDNH